MSSNNPKDKGWYGNRPDRCERCKQRPFEYDKNRQYTVIQYRYGRWLCFSCQDAVERLQAPQSTLQLTTPPRLTTPAHPRKKRIKISEKVWGRRIWEWIRFRPLRHPPR